MKGAGVFFRQSALSFKPLPAVKPTGARDPIQAENPVARYANTFLVDRTLLTRLSPRGPGSDRICSDRPTLLRNHFVEPQDALNSKFAGDTKRAKTGSNPHQRQALTNFH